MLCIPSTNHECPRSLAPVAGVPWTGIHEPLDVRGRAGLGGMERHLLLASALAFVLISAVTLLVNRHLPEPYMVSRTPS